MTHTEFYPFLAHAISAKPLPPAMMQDAIALILQGGVSDIETAGFLTSLRTRGETVEEITAAAKAMRAMAVKVEAPDDVVDTCGTGGDGAGTYNISTTAALIAAGAGVSIAKHGNKAATSKSGSSEVLASLGVNLDASSALISRCINEAGIGFMFAAYHHKAVAHVAHVRKSLGTRTLFNLLGPLTNPAGANYQLMGVFDPTLVEPLARVLRALGGERAWVVHGADGLDELTITGPSMVCAVDGDRVTSFEVVPEDIGICRAEISAIKGGTPEENAVALRACLNGQTGPYRDISVLNAAAAIVISGKVDTLQDGAELARHSIDNGDALKALSTLVDISQQKLT